MGIYLNSWGDQRVSNRETLGTAVSLFATLKAEILAEDDTVATVNEGVVRCLPGSTCITKAGEVLILDSSDAWAEI